MRTEFGPDYGNGLLSIFTTLLGSVRLQLQVGAENRGLEPAEVSEPFMEAAARFAAASDAGGLFPGGGYTGTLTVDAAGNSSFTSSSTGGLDLRASLDGPDEVDFPLSLQTVDLGIVQPGERLLLGYRAIITLERNGDHPDWDGDGLYGAYGDPDMLRGRRNPLAPGYVLVSTVPEPRVAFLCLAGLAVIALRKRLRVGS